MKPAPQPFALLAALVLMPGFLCATTLRMSLSKAIKQKTVAVTTVSNGGYMGKGLHLHLQNMSDHELLVDIDPALIFTPSDSSFQNLVAVGDETIAMEAGRSSEVELQTFCGKSYAHSPETNIKYTLWKQGDAGLVKAIQYIHEQQLYGFVGQHAVWSFTNNHPVSSIYDPVQPAASAMLATLVAQVKKVPVPEFYEYHKIAERAGQTAFSPEVTQLFVPITWSPKSHRNTVLGVWRADGSLYKRLQDGEVITDYGRTHSMTVTFDPKKDPPGIYYIRLIDEENEIWLEKKVEVRRG